MFIVQVTYKFILELGVQDGSKGVVAYFSKTLSKAQRIYCVTCRELLTIVKTLEHFHKLSVWTRVALTPRPLRFDLAAEL